MSTPRVGAYVRISDDPSGQALGVARQEQDCRKLADLRGWVVSEVYADNDVSAFKRGVVRPAFERMLEDLEKGRLDGLVCYDLDRFCRQPRDLERAIDIYDGGSLLFSTVTGDVNLGTQDGIVMARVMAAFANKASHDTRRRVARKANDLADRGIPVGGRPFGWKPDKRALDPEEAGQIRRGAVDILAGKSLGQITNEWIEQGVRTSRGNTWSRQTLRTMYLAPRMAGFRVYRGEVHRDSNGTPVRGQFEAVLDVATWEAVRDKIAPPDAIRSSRPGGRRYLLSGLIRCANCGTSMRGNAASDKGHFYSCPPLNQGGCGATNVTGPRVDSIVEEQILSLPKVTFRRTGTGRFPKAQELDSASERLSELMHAYTSGAITGGLAFPAIRRLEHEIHQLRQQDRAWQAESRPPLAFSYAEDWPSMSTAQRRDYVSAFIHAVVVEKSKHKGGSFDRNRIAIAWKEGAPKPTQL